MPVDLTRSLLVILIPGAVAAAPWLLVLVLYTSATLGYVEKYTTIANAVCFAVAVIAGLICETLGTWIEVRWDKQREKAHDISENWFAYLAHQLPNEPVGYRYLSRLATMLYFELAMLIASVPFAIGVWVLLYLRFPQHALVVSIAMSLGIVAVVIYFKVNAKKTHEVLCVTRRQLNERIRAAQASTKMSDAVVV